MEKKRTERPLRLSIGITQSRGQLILPFTTTTNPALPSTAIAARSGKKRKKSPIECEGGLLKVSTVFTLYIFYFLKLFETNMYCISLIFECLFSIVFASKPKITDKSRRHAYIKNERQSMTIQMAQSATKLFICANATVKIRVPPPVRQRRTFEFLLDITLNADWKPNERAKREGERERERAFNIIDRKYDK